MNLIREIALISIDKNKTKIPIMSIPNTWQINFDSI